MHPKLGEGTLYFKHALIIKVVYRFKHPTPHGLWGIFPRLAYDIFAMKEGMDV
jgi:hypothetical protein